MTREHRIELIRTLEQLTGSYVITYITSDRQPFGGRIAEDAVRPMYDHILSFGEIPENSKVSLYVYSRGGNAVVPWRIISMLRENFKEVNVLIPYKAHSATTMIALGADKIVMGKKAELGPIDPTLERIPIGQQGQQAGPPEVISVEDVSSYISFMRERAKITDQQALADVMKPLADNLTPLMLGRTNREYSHIRLVAKKLLLSHNDKIEEERMNTIVEALTEKIYSHGHAIGRKEVMELGLPAIKAPLDLERAMWELYLEYESYGKFNEPIDFETTLRDTDHHPIEEKELPNMLCACIESKNKLHRFEHNVIIKRKRKIPPNLQINFNINLGLPSNINMQSLSAQTQAQFQQLVQQLLQQIQNQMPTIIQNELVKQSPTIGFEVSVFGGIWKE